MPRVADPARIIAAAVFVLAAVALAACALGPFFTISGLSVEGTHHSNVDAIVTTAGLTGAPTFTASAGRARERLLRLPAVREARVEIALPDRVRIVVTERNALGRWSAAGVEWFIDEEGVLFPSIDPRGAPDVRISDERGARQAGERIDPALVEAAFKLSRTRGDDFRPDAGALRVLLTTPYGLVLRSASGWEIRFGTAERMEEKIAIAKRLLRENPARKLDYLDVRTPESIVVSPR